MGNKANTLTLRYGHEKKTLDYHSLESFEQAKYLIKNIFKIEDTFPIVIKSENHYISSSHNWEKVPMSKNIELDIWPQVELFVRDSLYSQSFIPNIVKIQKKKSGEVKGLGLFISRKICVVPYQILGVRNSEALAHYKMVFFNEKIIDLNSDIMFGITGESNSIYRFILIVVEVENLVADDWGILLHENTPKIRGQIIFFSSTTQMLSEMNCPYHLINIEEPFMLDCEKNEWIPGAIFIGKQGEVIGIFTKDSRNLFYPIRLLLRDLSDLLDRAIDRNNTRLRDALLDVKNIEYKMRGCSDMIKVLLNYREQQVEIRNSLSDIFS